MTPYSTDTEHECSSGKRVIDAHAIQLSNEHGERWCADCGERIVADWCGDWRCSLVRCTNARAERRKVPR